MLELELGILGALLFFLLSHLAMLTYYKKYDYWWHYYCDLGYTIPQNRLSMLFYKAGLIIFAVFLMPLWINIDSYLTVNAVFIKVAGIIGCISFILMVLFPYERSRRLHFLSLFSAFTGLTAAFLIANQELQHALLNVYAWCFLVYISVVILTTARYRKEMKLAHKYQAPVQKTFVILFLVTVIVFCLNLSSA
ncbi:MAG TPA: hypothetical protein ENN68_00900 [Methanomicrobia archaeon]|nr:hypothetical protein [Methanomicrobia archaeon]